MDKINNIDELALELELVPIARAMTGQEVEEMRKISPAWCIRRETAAIYMVAQRSTDGDILTALSHYMETDPYLLRAVQNMSEAPQTSDIANRMHNGWLKRTEQDLLTRFLQSTTAKQKVGYLTALQSLYRVANPNVYVVDMSRPLPPEEFLLTWGGTNFIPKGDITTIKAKAKSGKTQLAKQIIAALISPTKVCNGLERVPDEPCKVLWMDTEQSHNSSFKAYRTVLKLAGLDETKNDPHLVLVNTRMQGYKERLEILQDYTRRSDYDVVVLDGIKDVVRNINDPAETDELMGSILRLTQDSKINMLCIIHENPQNDADKMRGWLGTELANKSFEIFEVRQNRDTEIFTVENTERREQNVPPYGFKFEDNNLVQAEPESKWSQSQSQIAPEREDRSEREWNQFTKAWEQNPDLSMTQKEIVQAHLKMGTIKQSTVKNRIEQYLAQKKLTVDGAGRGARYGLSLTEKAKLKQRLEGPSIDPISGTDTTDNSLPF